MRVTIAAAAALAALIAPRAVAAAPRAHIETTFDARPARVTVEPTGELAVDGTPIARLAPAIAAASLEAGDALGTPTIVATITTGADTEAVVFELRGTWRRVVRERVGAVDPDGDYATAIGLAPNGIVRYQARAGLRRCDGKPAYFFAEGWNAARGRFQRLATIPTEVDPAAPALTARPDAAPAPVPLLYQARVASREPGAADVGGLGIPTALDDGDPATAWADDHAKSVGQFFTFEPRTGVKAAQLRFVAARTGVTPTELALVGAGAAYHVALPPARPGAAYVVDLPSPITGCVTAVLEAPDAGGMAIAELEVFADGERTGGGEAVLAALVAAGADGAEAAAQALARRGAAAVTALDAVLATAKGAAARGRIARALVATNDPSAGPVLAKAARELRLRADDLAAVLAALGALGQLEVLAELADATELDVPGRVAAVQAIGAAPGDHAQLLVPLAGKGPPDVRRAVIDALTRVPVAELAPAATAAPVAATAGDLWRAVTRRGHEVAAERAAAAAALLAALPAAADYERRYRLVDGLAELGDAAGLAAIDALLQRLAAGADRAAIALVAARGVAAAPRPEALALAVELARDADPGVRAAALTALGGNGDDTAWHAGPDAIARPANAGRAAPPDAVQSAIDRVLETALASDTWPELRRHAAEVLGNRCARSGPARALAASVGRDPELEVRDGALGALVQCKAPGTGALLATVWDDAKLPVALRQRAVDLAPMLGDRALGARLVDRLAGWRGAALESSDALALAQSAAYAIGRLAPPGAADALLAALADGAYPEIVAAAASGLGLLGPSCPPAAKAQLRALAQNEEQQIALAAGRAAAQCGR